MEYTEEDKLRNLKNQLNTIRTNRLKVKNAQSRLTILGFVENLELTSDGSIAISEVDKLMEDIYEALTHVLNTYAEYEKAILDILEESVPDVKYELKVYLQKSKKTVRYYYGSTYVFSAPLELKEVFDIEFTRIMNEEPKKTVTEAIESLRNMKQLLEIIFLEEPVEVVKELVDIEEGAVTDGI